MSDLIIKILCTLGAFFVLVASLGIYRMPDFYTRLSVTVKAGTIGVGCILSAAAIHFYTFSVTTKVLAIVFFVMITSPVAAYMISRAAYAIGVKLWKHSIVDEIEGMKEIEDIIDDENEEID